MDKTILVVVIVIGVIAVISLIFSIGMSGNIALKPKPASTNLPQADGGWTPGQFLVMYQSYMPADWCNYSGNNYDPFEFGTIYTNWGNRADACNSTVNMIGWSCAEGNISVARWTFWECTKGCASGKCRY